MCGLTGFWGPMAGGAQARAAALGRMCQTLKLRGPDAQDQWHDGARGVSFGHQRLSIQDLSQAGLQPMTSADGRWTMVYNGEVYNKAELREELGAKWRGSSDTEVLLEAIAAWGLTRAIERSVGMFALAVWDREQGTLSLVRDRLGIKPLYWSQQSGVLMFGSTLGALMAHPDFSRDLDHTAISEYLRYSCFPGELCVYRRTQKVLPGQILRFASPTAPPITHTYWSIPELAKAAAKSPWMASDREMLETLEGAMNQAVRLRLLADVPIGAFLSGGIDSSLVVALMQQHMGVPVRTFSIGFEHAAYDESESARAVAEHLGTDHTMLRVSEAMLKDVIPDLPHIYDEPFADSSQIPTTLVSRLARQEITVALSGDGGDETFAGYNRHLWLPRVLAATAPIPAPLRHALGRGLCLAKPATLARGFEAVSWLLPKAMRVRLPAEKLVKLGHLLGADTEQEAYDTLTSLWKQPEQVVRGAKIPPPRRWLGHPDLGVHPLPAKLAMVDMLGYLPDDILTKVDRASMSVSLEARVPLLDHRLVELAIRTPMRLKIRDGESKWAMRQILDKHVPRALMQRPKMGFGVPLETWLRGQLKPWAHALLEPGRLRAQGVFDAKAVQAVWQAHQAGHTNAQHQLWSVLMFQSWWDQKHSV